MQSNLRAQAEIQAQRKKVRRTRGSCPGALGCAARRCSYPQVARSFCIFWRVCTLADADGQQLANSYKQLLE
jgi:hypothetical protein